MPWQENPRNKTLNTKLINKNILKQTWQLTNVSNAPRQ